MGSPRNSSQLYRRVCLVVILLGATFVAAQQSSRQGAAKEKQKRLRAVGLIAVSPSGQARLIPVAIMVNGEFFDASIYKAAPVPMALYSETVYEGFQTGVSQGLFTVQSALEGPNNTWSGVGTWRTTENLSTSESKKKKVTSEPRDLEESDSPPTLRHSGGRTPQPPDTEAKASTDTTEPSSSTTGQPSSTSSPAETKTNTDKPEATKSTGSTPPPAAPAPETDAGDTPVLHRGKPAEPPTSEPLPKISATARPTPAPARPTPVPGPSANSSASTKAPTHEQPQVKLIAGISDSTPSRDERSYAFLMSPEQEQQLRQKMIAMAGAAVAAHAPQSEAAKVQVPAKSAHTATKTPKLLQPNFQSTQMRVFDLTNTNDAILILTATATLPQRNGESGPEVHYFVTCVARQDVNGDLHKALVNVTDSNHMDVIPRLDLIDAVDVDGDGRGELLFRKVSDDATGYVIYRVIGDQLYPLFESALS